MKHIPFYFVPHRVNCFEMPSIRDIIIFSRQASLARQAFLITTLHGARYKTGKNAYAKKKCYVIICKINAPSATLLFPTIPLLYAKDQCEALSEGEIGDIIYNRYQRRPCGHVVIITMSHWLFLIYTLDIQHQSDV